jgi:hypothetical protein
MDKPKISVCSPTIRPLGLKLVKQALTYQNLKGWEWIVCSPETMRKEVFSVIGDFPFTFIGTPPLQDWQVWDLNYSYNRMIEKADGELIVSWQDYTFADPDLFCRLWQHYVDDPKALVSVCGNKYPDDDFDVPAWIDPRYGTSEPNWKDVEWNLCSCPRKLLYDIGGFDENMDKMFGLDGFSVNHRLEHAKLAHFKLEKNSQSYSLFHGRVKDWDRQNWLEGGDAEHYNKMVEELKKEGSWPYLDKRHCKLTK